MERIKCLMKKNTVLILVISALFFYISVEKKRLQALIKLSEKNHSLYLLSTQWLYRKINGEEVFACLVDSGYKKIAVYGRNHSCECLCSELESMDVEVSCIIDDGDKGRYGNIPIIAKSRIPDDVDAIIVTNIENIDLIRNTLRPLYAGPILALADIVKWGS